MVRVDHPHYLDLHGEVEGQNHDPAEEQGDPEHVRLEEVVQLVAVLVPDRGALFVVPDRDHLEDGLEADAPRVDLCPAAGGHHLPDPGGHDPDHFEEAGEVDHEHP